MHSQTTLCLLIFSGITIGTALGTCDYGDVRLMNGTAVAMFEGRVEVCFSGEWISVCDSMWDSNSAEVTCRQLGLIGITPRKQTTCS